jgi:mRNA-degrading endonuclease RelE of RelBE toxin-antitoxin system
MTYDLEFDPRALKEWHKLGDTVRQQFKKKLAEIRKILVSRPTDYENCQIVTRSNYAALDTASSIKSKMNRLSFLLLQ